MRACVISGQASLSLVDVRLVCFFLVLNMPRGDDTFCLLDAIKFSL